MEDAKLDKSELLLCCFLMYLHTVGTLMGYSIPMGNGYYL